ncbi:TIM-barrel domain-containing protein [Salinibacterium sp. TMP30]|uniref:glycoside hydrolase family 31 protein n=1 Tax=Salinibacterium sp. TMP30 TaxID=3138237 RepID=UPI003139ECCC
MIRHRPFGSGHPYSVDTEQRWPVDPIAGESLTLGVRTSGAIDAVTLELVRAQGGFVEIPLDRVVRSSRGQSQDGGHLASAQARLARSEGGWQTKLEGLNPHEQCRYRFTTGAERTRWFDFRVSAWRDAADVDGARIVPGTTTVLDNGESIQRVRFAIRLAPGEHVAGFGERFDAIDHRGSSLDSVVFEQYKSQGAERKTYLPMPFAHVVGGDGWGFHVRTSRRVWFDIGESEPSLLWVEAEGSTIDVAFYDGSPTEVLNAFLAEVGRPEELPSWVFRLWASGNEWNTQAEVMRQMDAHREHQIPVGNLVIEAWSDESTFTAWRGAQYEIADRPHTLNDFTFPADGPWPSPKNMINELHSRKTKVHLWQIPLLKMRPHPQGQLAVDAEAAKREGVLVQEVASDGSLRPYRNRGWWFPLGLMPDLTDERAAHWWTERRRYLVDELGVDGFKTDGGEHAWGRDVRYLDGRHGDEVNGLFPVSYAKAYGDLLRRCGKAPVTFSRAGFTGSQSHGAFWAGDENSTWDSFRWSMFAGLSACSSGILYWGWDLAGFSGDVPTAELYLRSIAAAAFVPIMQYHSEFNHHKKPSNDRTPWNIAERTGEQAVVPISRKFVELRERLVPYLAEQSAAAIARGGSLMRPLFFDFADDERVWEFPLQWMLGDEILVAPVLEPGADEWATYLPAGDWVDAFTGEHQNGGRVIQRLTPLDELPVYVRSRAWDSLRDIFA